MRWESQSVEAAHDARLPGFSEDVVVRRFNAPEALDTRFHEVRTKSAINRVPQISRVPFEYTVNPYRGCSHACGYCFARPTHEYLDLDAGRDFEKEIIVKVNVPEVLRAELAKPSWGKQHIAMGTNTDPYQWVEGRYKLMRGIWEALRDARNPCSILTKSPLLLRDLDLMKTVARRLRHRNIAIAIDELGMEWTSFLGLHDLPFVELKVDPQFIAGCADDRRRQATCGRILELADAMGARTVADGVASRADFLAVREMGFHLAQGALFASPMTAEELARSVPRHPAPAPHSS